MLFVIMSAAEGTTSSGENSSTTTSWNHLVGKTGTEAQEYIQKEHPKKKVVIVKQNMPVVSLTT